jgi:arylsulfatase
MPTRPNILLITTDQQRKDSIGCYGNDVVETPNLDRIADRGVRFERMFAAYPVCAPNRASIATGRYPSIHRLRQNGMRFPSAELTIMEMFRRAGYGTYGSGKMHFGPQWEFPADGKPIRDPDPSTAIDPQPTSDAFPWCGFDRVMLTEDHRTGPYGRYLASHGYDVWDELHSASYPQSATVASAFPEEHHQTTWITDRAIEFLDDHPDDTPFFLWTSYVHPHHPFNPPAPYDTMYESDDMPLPVWDPAEVDRWPDAYKSKYTALGSGHEAVGLDSYSDDDWRRIKAYYYGMISQIDANIGRILDHLATRGILDNTIVMFTTDHGEMLGDHHLLFKGTTYDCVTNVPCIIAGPGVSKEERPRNLLASSIDIAPTLIELSGIDAPAPAPFQGTSLVPAIHDESVVVRDALLMENAGVRRSIRTKTELLTWHGESTRGEFYDLAVDPDCLENLWDDPRAERRKSALLDRLIGLMSANVDPLPVQEGPW